VIAGDAKGRRLRSVRDQSVRPMTDQIREALFSTLGESVPRARFLDLYAGSGAIGIEALSRGASHATFVESDRAARDAIESNVEVTGFEARAEVVGSDAAHFAETFDGLPFDLAVVDPPFAAGLPSGVLETMVRRGVVSREAPVVVRISTRLAAPEQPAGLRLGRTRKYGDSTLLYFSAAR
jgi:16S rRNA (guanine966-N2)-methyltransferase